MRLQARRAPEAVFRSADALFCNFEWIPLDPVILRRALDPFPKLAVLRTLDALHLATADFLRSRGGEVEIATYDKRLAAGARALGFPLAKL